MKTCKRLIMSAIVLGLTILSSSCKKDQDSEPEPKVEIKPLAIVTGGSSNVSGTRVTLTAEVTGDGGRTILERGYCGGNTVSVTLLANNKFTVSGKVGSFTINHNGLQPYTTYYVKPFVRTSKDTAYGEEISFTTGNLVVGDYYYGGYIFYINGSNFMVADSLDISTTGGCKYIGGAVIQTDSIIGTGQANTSAIVNYANSHSYNISGGAIGMADNSTSHGYTDWFLPSFEELKLMYTVLKANGIGNFSDSDYWTSTAYYGNPGNIMYTINFSNGIYSIYADGNNIPKTRAIRSFSINN